MDYSFNDKRNFHTHTSLCKHATGSIEDYCQAASQQGLSTLGFSDHCPFKDGRWDKVRMSFQQLPGYFSDIEAARAKFPQLRILKGLECEYVPEMMDYYKECFWGEHDVDYIIGAVHYYMYEGRWRGVFSEQLMSLSQLHSYTECAIGIITSGMFSFLAHPDAFGLRFTHWGKEADACFREIAQAAVEYDVPLELNTYGFRKAMFQDGNILRYPYPCLNVWKIFAEYPVKVVINPDAHSPEHVWGNIDQGLDMTKELKLNVINESFIPRKLF